MSRHFHECLWCNEPLTKKEVFFRGNYFCDQKCYRTASRSIRMGLAKRNSGGKSGIQPMLLGLCLKTLEQYPSGLILKDVVAITHENYSDYAKLLNASKLHHYFRIYLNADCYTRTQHRRATIYHIAKGSCLKDWLRPKYVEYLENYEA
jgi:hypothetical protein